MTADPHLQQPGSIRPDDESKGGEATWVDPGVHLQALFNEDRIRHRPAELTLSLGLLLGALALSTWLARSGLQRDRFLGWTILGCALLGLMAWSVRSWRRFLTPERRVMRTVGYFEERLAARVVRAQALLSGLETSPEQGSLDLARLHYEHVIAALPWVDISARLKGRALRWLLVGLLLLSVSFLLVLGRAWPTIEGLDLLLGSGRVAPFTLPYVKVATVTVTPPAYLGGSRKALTLWGDSANLPEGSTIRVELRVAINERDFVLTDGERETRFEPDGQGKLVAEMTLPETMVLRVAARFGERYILDPFDCTLFAEEDKPPTVTLAGAPRTLSISDMGRLSLTHEVRDDHGIVEVELVVESGRREERRELARPAKDVLEHKGITTLTEEHPLVRGAFLPVRVRIEAKDEKPGGGVVWGRSAEITLLPRPLGQALATRYSELKSFRDLLVSFYDEERQIALSPSGERKERRLVLQRQLGSAQVALEAQLTESSERSDGALAFLKAQVEALTLEGKDRLDPEHGVLAVDALLVERSQVDAKRLADDLASAVDEIAVRAKVGAVETDRELTERDLRDLIALARSGGTMLSALGTLGADLGGVAAADFGRMEASLHERALDRVERVAKHLAARLRRGKPSFGARSEAGSSGARGAVEGGSPGDAGDGGEGPASDAPNEYQRLEKAADRLAQDHANQLSSLEHWLREAERAARRDSATPEERGTLAEQLREAISGLPEAGAMPGSARSEAAMGRAQGEAAADALEAGDANRALERGRSALGAVERAQRLARETGSTVGSEDLSRAQRGLEEALRKAESLRVAGQRQPDGGLDRLREKAAIERKLADQTRDLYQKGQSSEARLSQEGQAALRRAEQWMRKGAAALDEGDADAGRAHLEHAQAEVERAVSPPPHPGRGAPPEGESTSGEGEGPEGPEYAKDGHVPDAETGLGRDFRQRVQSGLRDKQGRLGPAVSRYLERLQ